VFGHQPGLERRVQEGRGDAAQEAAAQEDAKGGGVLGEAAEGVDEDVGEGGFLAAAGVSSGGVVRLRKDGNGWMEREGTPLSR
jgi:hypothetical protein